MDGHAFIAKAVEQGAVAVVCEELPDVEEGVTYVLVEDSLEALGIIAANYYDNPSKKLTLVGVTGTNGKTTIATLLYKLTRALGHKVGLISTVCNYVDDTPIVSTHTTPDSLSLNSLLAQMVDAGCTYAFMEVSSHAVAQSRIAGLSFVGGIFTNLTHDHLDYHKTMDSYFEAKSKLFADYLNESAVAVLNADDPVFDKLKQLAENQGKAGVQGAHVSFFEASQKIVFLLGIKWKLLAELNF